jgi:outer membrane protein assembly factor BamB
VTWPGILCASLLGVNACTAVLHPAPRSQGRPWPAYLGSDTRAAAVPPALAAAPVERWRFHAGRGVVGAPALSEGLVALAQQDRKVVLLDRRTGAPFWRRNLHEDLGSGPLLAHDRVYVATQAEHGRVIALGLASGNTEWSTRVGPVAAPLAERDATIYAASLEGLVVALRAMSGEVVWRTRLPGAVRVPAVVVGQGVIVATAADSLFLLDRRTGTVRVRRATDGTVLAAPALADTVLLVGSTGGTVEACDPATLATLWRVPVGGVVVGAVAVQRDTAFALTGAGQLWTIPLDDPAAAAGTSLGIVARAGPTPVAGGVLVAGVDGRLEWVGRGGAARWTAKLRPPVAAPLVADGGDVLAVSERGEVVLFR